MDAAEDPALFEPDPLDAIKAASGLAVRIDIDGCQRYASTSSVTNSSSRVRASLRGRSS